jgi:WD40 repeat protein
MVVSDAKTGKILEKKKIHQDGISNATISKDEKTFVTVSLDKTLKIWDLESLGLLDVFSEPKERLIALAISPDGKWLATGGADKKVYLIRIR